MDFHFLDYFLRTVNVYDFCFYVFILKIEQQEGRRVERRI